MTELYFLIKTYPKKELWHVTTNREEAVDAVKSWQLFQPNTRHGFRLYSMPITIDFVLEHASPALPLKESLMKTYFILSYYRKTIEHASTNLSEVVEVWNQINRLNPGHYLQLSIKVLPGDCVDIDDYDHVFANGTYLYYEDEP